MARLIQVAALLLMLPLFHGWSKRGRPYFELPSTVMDHAGPEEHALRQVLLLMPKVAPLLPEGAEVAAFRPKDGAVVDDHDTYLAAVGLLPRQFVLPPFTAYASTPREQLVEWVIAVGEPLRHPHYAPVAGFPEGWLYQVRR